MVSKKESVSEKHEEEEKEPAALGKHGKGEKVAGKKSHGKARRML